MVAAKPAVLNILVLHQESQVKDTRDPYRYSFSLEMLISPEKHKHLLSSEGTPRNWYLTNEKIMNVAFKMLFGSNYVYSQYDMFHQKKECLILLRLNWHIRKLWIWLLKYKRCFCNLYTGNLFLFLHLQWCISFKNKLAKVTSWPCYGEHGGRNVFVLRRGKNCHFPLSSLFHTCMYFLPANGSQVSAGKQDGNWRTLRNFSVLERAWWCRSISDL